MSSAISVPSAENLQQQLEALKSDAVDAFSRTAIDGAMHALADTANPLRLNFFCAATRIFFEHMLGTLAPIEEVTKSPWFKPETKDEKPTRGQRIAFVIQGGLTDHFVKNQLGVDIAPLRRKLIAAVDKLSKHVHGREDTVVADPTEQNAQASLTIGALQDFLLAYHECRSAIIEPIQEKIDEAAVDALISETIRKLTNYRVITLSKKYMWIERPLKPSNRIALSTGRLERLQSFCNGAPTPTCDGGMAAKQRYRFRFNATSKCCCRKTRGT